ncbi:MAG: hypothetical protein KJ709_07680 [Nanoarchaeota archaeon]|nr:hypothetical protein [Nanoarchaeota archaeon]
MVIDYSKSESHAVSKIKEAIPGWLSSSKVSKEGLFADLHECKIFPDHLLASSVDGVGTKLLIAEAMHKYNTVGIDLVAMNANDLATLGRVSPFLFINYLACQRRFQEEGLTGDLMKGIVKGLEQSDTSTILRQDLSLNMGKGETASVDELLGSLKPGYGFDMAGAMIGFMKKEDLSEPEGDTLIALKSSGPHSNGFTALRHMLLKGEFENREEYQQHYKGRFSIDSPFEGSTIGRHLLEPTRIYMKTMAAIAKEFKVTGINNTGYGLKNLARLKGFTFKITDPIRPQPIFKLVQKEAKLRPEEMYERFNMGQGFFILCKKEDADDILSASEQQGEEGKVIGTAEKGPSKIIFKTKDADFCLEGYG